MKLWLLVGWLVGFVEDSVRIIFYSYPHQSTILEKKGTRIKTKGTELLIFASLLKIFK